MDNRNQNYDVVVVGAGLSGLTCAHLLCEAGLSTIVLEATGRTGGRIHSVREPSSGEYVADLGPTWVWPTYQPIITRWLDRLNINTLSQFEKGNAVFEFGPDIPARHHPAPGQDGISRLEGGPQALTDEIIRLLPLGTIKTDHAVTSFAAGNGGVTINTNNPALSTIRAKRVVVAIPPRIAHQNISWPSGFEKKVLQEMSETPTWMATQAKAVTLYDRPFWRKRGFSGRIASQVGPMVEAHDHSMPDDRQASLFGFIGWSPLERRSKPAELRDQISRQLVRCFGIEAECPVELHIEDWALNSMICSELDLTNPPSHPEVVSELLRTPHCEGRIYFSVSETAKQSPGLIEGAFSAAEDTANSLIADMHKY